MRAGNDGLLAGMVPRRAQPTPDPAVFTLEHLSLDAGARIDSCYLTVLVGTAFSTTAATIGSLTVYFR